MCLTLHIINGIHVQLLGAAPCRQNQIISRVAFDPADGPIEALGKGEIADGLENVIHGIHLVAPDGVLSKVRNEEDHNIRIGGAYSSGGFHAVHQRHRNIQQNEIELPP